MFFRQLVSFGVRNGYNVNMLFLTLTHIFRIEEDGVQMQKIALILTI